MEVGVLTRDDGAVGVGVDERRMVTGDPARDPDLGDAWPPTWSRGKYR